MSGWFLLMTKKRHFIHVLDSNIRINKRLDTQMPVFVFVSSDTLVAVSLSCCEY